MPSDLRRDVRCEEGVVLGDEVFVGEDAVISTDVKVYPFKTVEAGAVVNTSLIWESRGARSACSAGVACRAWPTSTPRPELAAKVALAFATSLKKDATVVVSRDSQPVGPHAEAGDDGGPATPAASTCMDLEVASVPLTRFHCRAAPGLRRGVTLRLSPDDPDTVIIRFFDGDGADILEDQPAQDRAAVRP